MKNSKYLLLVFFVFIFISCSKSEDFEYGKKAPTLSLFNTKDQVKKLSEFEGKLLVLRFWQKSCPSCLVEMPLLDLMYKELKNEIIVLGINMGDANKFISSFKKENNISYPMLRDELLIATKKYKVMGSPTSFIIDKKGILREVIIGDIEINKLKKKVLSYL